jgi:CPA1 family monovalent cation:H+ antiporter
MATLVAWLCATFALLSLSRLLSGKPLPLPTVQLLLGMAAGGAVSHYGIDSGLRWQDFHDLVIEVLLPVLVFMTALSLDRRALRSHLPSVLLLALVAIIITTAGVAVAVFYGIGHPTGFPIAAALLTGVLLAATDPAAVTSQGGHSRVAELLEGESLFNDGTAVALFSAALTLALATRGTADGAFLTDTLTLFAREFFGGMAIGAGCGLALRWTLRRTANDTLRHWLLFLAALAFYHGAVLAHTSGIMCVLVAGLIASPRVRRDAFVNTLEQTTGGFLFLLAGFTVTWAMFAERWLAMLIGIGAVLLARTAAIFLCLGAARLWTRPPLTVGEQTGVALLGLRGAVTLALALSLPTELPYWWTVQSIAYGVVLFDAFLLAPMAPWLTRQRARPSRQA